MAGKAQNPVCEYQDQGEKQRITEKCILNRAILEGFIVHESFPVFVRDLETPETHSYVPWTILTNSQLFNQSFTNICIWTFVYAKWLYRSRDCVFESCFHSWVNFFEEFIPPDLNNQMADTGNSEIMKGRNVLQRWLTGPQLAVTNFLTWKAFDLIHSCLKLTCGKGKLEDE